MCVNLKLFDSPFSFSRTRKDAKKLPDSLFAEASPNVLLLKLLSRASFADFGPRDGGKAARCFFHARNRDQHRSPRLC